MSASNFIITTLTSPTQHIREFPHAVTNPNASLKLSVKRYVPRNNPTPSPADITLLAAHANGFPKECYEALWDELLVASASNGFKIRAIWIADCAHQGQSYGVNKDVLGDDPGWFDHSRDLLLMVNEWRSEFVGPVVGVGHSMGGCQIAYLSTLHPRLLHSLILIEPIIQDSAPPGPNAALFTSFRRETWPSRSKAESSITRNPFFSVMDPRVLQTYLKFALTDLPDGTVTLTTPKAQEAWSYVRSNFQDLPAEEERGGREARYRERLLSPDLEPFSASSTTVFVRPEAVVMKDLLPSLRPHVLYIYGDFSPINFDDVREDRLPRTGTGRGGSGGAEEGCVEEVVIEEAGHLVCFERPRETAAKMGEWLGREVVRWKREQEFYKGLEMRKSKGGRRELSEEWLRGVREEGDWQRGVAKKGGAKL